MIKAQITSIEEEFEKGRGKDKTPRKKRKIHVVEDGHKKLARDFLIGQMKPNWQRRFSRSNKEI